MFPLLLACTNPDMMVDTSGDSSVDSHVDEDPDTGTFVHDGVYAELDHYGLTVSSDRTALFQSGCGYADIASTPVIDGTIQWTLDWRPDAHSDSGPYPLVMAGTLLSDRIIATLTSEDGHVSDLELVFGSVYSPPRCP